jgi:uncharacterized circularly permuted ATP-grasp superfamily protein
VSAGIGAAPEAAARYNALLLADPAAAEEQSAWLEGAFHARGLTFGGVAMRSFLRPHLIERRHWDVLRHEGRQVLEIAARAARHAFGGDVRRLFAFLGTPDAEARYVAHDPGPPDVVLSRLDAFLTEAGPRFIEINSDAPAGFGYGDRMAAVFEELPVFRRFAEGERIRYEPSMPTLVRTVLETYRAQRGPGDPVVGIVDWADVKTRADQEILREAFETAGVRCVLADPRDLSARGGRLVGPDGGIDVVYRRAVLTELVQREGEVRGFLDAYLADAGVFVNTFRCRLSEDKAFFAVLTDEAYDELFTADERALLQRAVPWTRKMEERRTRKDGREIDLVPWVAANRWALVLKPAHGYGGDSVLVGTECDDRAWQVAVERSLGAPWVVQERVDIPEEPFPVIENGELRLTPLKVNVNPFYVAGADVGAVTRCSRSAVINVSAGGGSLPTFVVG